MYSVPCVFVIWMFRLCSVHFSFATFCSSFFFFLLVPWLCPGVLLVYQPMCIYTPVSYVFVRSCQCMASVGMLSFVSCIPCFSGIVEFILYFHLVLINLLHLDPTQFTYFTHRCTFTHQNEKKAYFLYLLIC